MFHVFKGGNSSLVKDWVASASSGLPLASVPIAIDGRRIYRGVIQSPSRIFLIFDFVLQDTKDIFAIVIKIISNIFGQDF